jgi:hypothetical protein
MREIVRFYKMFQIGYDVFVPDDLIECTRSVFLGPDHLFHDLGIVGRCIKIIGAADARYPGCATIFSQVCRHFLRAAFLSVPAICIP